MLHSICSSLNGSSAKVVGNHLPAEVNHSFSHCNAQSAGQRSEIAIDEPPYVCHLQSSCRRIRGEKHCVGFMIATALPWLAISTEKLVK